MNDSTSGLSRRALGGLAASASGLLLATGSAQAAEPTTTQQVRERLPVLARHEGVWDGTFRRVDADGQIVEEFQSRIIKRFLPDEFWPMIYHQTNIYDLPDGTKQVIDTKGKYIDGKVWFESERVDGWQLDDTADPFNRTVFL
ncbi:MAG: hypothetical protein HOO09_11655, partial [Rhodospirillaceae bacterium]|nr:hypothetical protein [Rhodospirillaceae bacterium]